MKSNSPRAPSCRLPVGPANKAAPLRPELVAFFAFGLSSAADRTAPACTGILAELAEHPGAGWN